MLGPRVEGAGEDLSESGPFRHGGFVAAEGLSCLFEEPFGVDAGEAAEQLWRELALGDGLNDGSLFVRGEQLADEFGADQAASAHEDAGHEHFVLGIGRIGRGLSGALASAGRHGHAGRHTGLAVRSSGRCGGFGCFGGREGDQLADQPQVHRRGLVPAALPLLTGLNADEVGLLEGAGEVVVEVRFLDALLVELPAVGGIDLDEQGGDAGLIGAAAAGLELFEIADHLIAVGPAEEIRSQGRLRFEEPLFDEGVLDALSAVVGGDEQDGGVVDFPRLGRFDVGRLGAMIGFDVEAVFAGPPAQSVPPAVLCDRLIVLLEVLIDVLCDLQRLGRRWRRGLD